MTETSVFIKLAGAVNELHQNDHWRQTQRRFDLHPLIKDILISGREPDDIARLAFEWPHESETGDRSKIAYARDERAHAEQRYTRCSLAKYIRRHWSCLKDHEIRDLVAPYSSSTFELLTDVRDMVVAALFGPKSCMQWGPSDIGMLAYESARLWLNRRDDNGTGWQYSHPYAAYDPSLGWGVAVRKDGAGQIAGRAVVHLKEKIFVRTYVLRSDPFTQSSDDDALKAWLLNQGFKKADYWPEGVEFSNVNEASDVPFMPYLDSAHSDTYRRVRVDGDRIVRDDEGDYIANCTDGSVSEIEPVALCEYCGADIRNEDNIHTARYCGYEVTICPDCADTHFVEAHYAFRFGSDETLVYEGDVVQVYAGDSCMQLWDSTALDDSIVGLDEPTTTTDGSLCDYAYKPFTVTTHDGRTIMQKDAVEVDGRIYCWNDPEIDRAREAQAETETI